MKKLLSLLLCSLLTFGTASAALQDIVTKGSTSRSVTVDIVDSTDGTPELAVVFNTSGIDLWYRREGAARTAITEATLASLTTAWASGGFLHVSDGTYRLDLPDAAFATGANYVDFGGTVTGMVVIGGRVRLVDTNLEVAAIPANITQFGGANGTFAGGRPEVNASHFGGTPVSASACTGSIPALGIIDCGTAQAVTGTTLRLRSAANFDANDEIVGATCVITGGTTGVGQSRPVSAYTNSTDTATVATWTTTPTGTVTYACFGTASSTGGGSGLDAAATRAALGLTSANLDTQLAAIQADTDNLQTRVPASLVSGRMDSSVGAMANNTMTAAAAASDLTTELQTGLATSSALSAISTTIGVAGAGLTAVDDAVMTRLGAPAGASISADIAAVKTDTAAILVDTGTTLDGKLDTIDSVVDAIKAKTDNLTFTVTGQVDANAESMNAVEILGSGTQASPWNGE